MSTSSSARASLAAALVVGVASCGINVEPGVGAPPGGGGAVER